MTRRLITHAVFAYDEQPYIGDGGRLWTCLGSGDEVRCHRLAAKLRAACPGREVEVRPYSAARGGPAAAHGRRGP